MDLAALRQEYMRAGLHEKDLNANPLAQFGTWFEEALRSGIALPNAMTLATATRKGRPSARTVLLGGAGAPGRNRGRRHARIAGRVGRIFRKQTSRKPAVRDDFAAKRGGREPRSARDRARGRCEAVRRVTAAAGELGRLPPRAGAIRVL